MRFYRAPRPEDDVAELVAARLAEKLPEWEALDLVPSEEAPETINDDRPIQYGMPRWRDLFSPRQLLGHGTSVEIFHELFALERAKPGFSDATAAAFGYLAIVINKILNWNARLGSWNVEAERLRSVFDRHDFAFKWTFGEMAPLITGLGYDWAIEQTRKCLEELIALGRPKESLPLSGWTPPPVTVGCKSADALDQLADGSVDLVVIDPPYYDNLMYAELSDFVYVWLKRTAGLVLPELFTNRLTDKEREAVANPARFRGEERPRESAFEDYRTRMQQIFAECRRVLKPEGRMVLMFNHKATGAWDALATGLIEAGFCVTASWPIESEAEGSLHQKGKAAASSTIFLVCEPRPARAEAAESPWWEDLGPEVVRTVRAKAEEFEKAGIRGVDLYLACFGPALEVPSRHWPVKRARPKPAPSARKRREEAASDSSDPHAARPEDALLAARREVKAWRLRQLLGAARRTELDPLGEWFVLAWDAFGAPRSPFDEALQLARVVGVELEGEVIGRIAEKKGEEVILLDSLGRRNGHKLGPPDGSRSWLDAIHHAAALTRASTAEAAKTMLEEAGVLQAPELRAALQAVLEVLPVGSTFTGIDPVDAVAAHAADFDALERLRRVAFEAVLPKPHQLQLFERKAA